MIFELGPDVAPGFDNFLVGENGEVVAHLRALATGALPETSLLLWGAPGSGKSHLVAAGIATALQGGTPAFVVRIDGEPLPEVAVDSLYAIEDVDRLSDAAQGQLFTLFNVCRERGARLLMSARTPPLNAPLRDDLRTRIGWGLVLELKPLADADKPAALAAYAAQQGFRLSGEVVAFLLSHMRRDMGTLLAMLRALDRHSLSTKRPVTVPLVRELLQPEIALETRSPSDVA
ncbi:MAG: DnaA regulatory inactivator Hda [Betaproteobacteria bacterium]